MRNVRVSASKVIRRHADAGKLQRRLSHDPRRAVPARRADGRSSSRRRGKRAKAFFTQEHAEGVDADGVPGIGEFELDVVDGQVAFAHGDDDIGC